MNNKIKILHLEDSFKDSELIQSIIESGEIGHEYFLADNEEDFINILETENIDIILSDFSLPDYNGNQALKVAREKFSRIPFIFVSGAMGEDAAINAMLNGATDYVLKNKLERLVPAITRAINEHKLELNRSRAVAELKESEERFKAIFNDAPMGIALVDSLTGKIHNVNPMFAKIAGRTIEEMINIDWMSITHPDDIQLDLNNMAKLVAGEINGFRIEKRYVHPDGSFVWINMTVSQILYKDKSHPRHLCMIEDITERKRAEQELIIAGKELDFQNEEKEKRAAELIIANKELSFQNREKEKRADELILANKELVFQNEEKEKRAAELIIANKELAFQNLEKEKRAAELIIANKELAFQNREKEKRADELIIANKELLFQNEEKENRAAELIIANKELLFQNEEKEKRAAELIIANKELAFQNREKEKRADELILANKELAFQNEEKEKRAAELFVANTELAFQNLEKEKRAAELNIANKELAFQNEEKEKRAAELIIANEELAFQNKEKEKRASELFIANIELLFQNEEKEKRANELIIAKEKAEESDRLKSAFLANMSHEIRTPMNGIMSFAELLKEPELSGDEKEYFIGIIEKSGVRMLNIISDILNISKIESGQMNVTISETNVNEQVENIYTLFKPEVEEKGMQIFFKNSLPDTKSIIKTDQEKIHAILTNLVKNAIKFTNTGSVEFGYCLKTHTELEFFVKDTGIGIRPEQIEIIFERFRQVSESLNRKYEGAGLGLSISKAFVEMLGGKIWVESELGKGTTIYFTIPYDIVTEENHISKNLVLNKSYLNGQHASVEKSSK